VAEAAAGICSEDGVLFRVVDAPDEERRAAHPAVPALPAAEQVASDEARLRALRAAAAAHAKRRFSLAASAEAHGRDQRAGDEAGEPGPPRAAAAAEYAGEPVERSVALAAGTAVHALLEAGRLDAAAADGPLERAVTMAALPGEREAALAHARSVWRRFADGPLAPRLAALAPHVVARELPVWLAPAAADAAGPAGFVAGAIDLLYRDPASGQLVVADYKTDAVGGADLAGYAQRYAAQGEYYARAVQQALGLAAKPRFELWFLAAGEVHVAG
jgi:ATP-dependent exoDNAse (exonuclease V) beta subunit